LEPVSRSRGRRTGRARFLYPTIVRDYCRSFVTTELLLREQRAVLRRVGDLHRFDHWRSGIIWTEDFSHTGAIYYAQDWTSFSVTFVADSSTTTLKFLDSSHFPTGYDPSYTVGGSTLDNVMVIGVVPEPGGIAAALTTLGFCLVLIAAHRCAAARGR
jgi:hypothetical protein